LSQWGLGCGDNVERRREKGMILLGREALGRCKSEMLKKAYFIALIMNEDFLLSLPKTTINTAIRYLNCDTVEK